jgi:uroporphyrin-III C-methyltransferase/precorrin-2 dehydrogenase/sirohydrochlorin ferrochelatase
MTRSPTETRPARLAPLAKLPIFLDLAGKRVVIAGGGEPAAWKAELLAAAGARVSVLAEAPCAELLALVAAGRGELQLENRVWRESDLDGAVLALADEEDPDEAARFAAAARRRGCLVNVIDRPAFCDFQFGTIVNRSPVVIGIGTDGAAPILGQAIRRRIEAILPASLGAWVAAARDFRGRVKDMFPARADRRRFWEAFVDRAFAADTHGADRPAALERLAREQLAQTGAGELPQVGRTGEVVIVGAGPGDPELVTMRALRELQAADVIVYDRLVLPEVLELGRREARRINVGKQGHGAACRQDDISALLVDLARSGQRVVRLKGGDPSVFGRTSEEADTCRAAGVPVRIVPGVTTASAAAASLGLSLTDRRHAQRLQFVTGHDRNGAVPPELDLDALADRRATTVIYMGRRTAGLIARELLERGLPATTPAVVIANVSRADEHRRRTSVAELASGAAIGDDGAPTLVLIGATLAAEGGAAAAIPAELRSSAGS